VTEYRVADRLGGDATLVEARPRTGRMHQIRVHLASIGHPVLGDASYGTVPADPALRRAMLHAAVLGFTHPASGSTWSSARPCRRTWSARWPAVGPAEGCHVPGSPSGSDPGRSR